MKVSGRTKYTPRGNSEKDKTNSKKVELLQKFNQGLSVRHLLRNMVKNLYDKEKRQIEGVSQ